MNQDFPLKDETYAIRGAIFEVNREKGTGFSESVYQECLELELAAQNIPFASQPILRLEYKGTPLRSTFQPDLICYNEVIVELKAVKTLTDDHRAQVHNYLVSSGLRLALLVNFGHHPKTQIERIIK